MPTWLAIALAVGKALGAGLLQALQILEQLRAAQEAGQELTDADFNALEALLVKEQGEVSAKLRAELERRRAAGPPA